MSRKYGGWGWCGLAFMLALATGCELLVNLDDLNDRQCGANEKKCDNRCVSITDPATGCGAPDSCAPCALLHASARCDGKLCVIGACIGDYADCDKDNTSCETDLAHDPEHCSDCNAKPCTIANGIAGCSAGQCAVGGCFDGWDDCNRDWRDGCERPLGTAADCASCNQTCGAGMTCAKNICM